MYDNDGEHHMSRVIPKQRSYQQDEVCSLCVCANSFRSEFLTYIQIMVGINENEKYHMLFIVNQVTKTLS